MSENNKLYFIPILMKALESKNQIEAMENALLEIAELGKHKEYQEGYEQYKKFIESGIQSQKTSPKIQEELLKRIKSNPDLLKKYFKTEKEHEVDISLEVYKEEKLINSQSIHPKEDELTISNIESGNYSIRLSNGRVIWEGVIKSEDVTIDKSQPQKDYRLAAETKGLDIAPTRTIELIKHEMYLYVYDGLEFGKFKIVEK